MRNREDLTQLRPTVAFEQTGKDPILREFVYDVIEERVLELS
jgi:hypothetical protein